MIRSLPWRFPGGDDSGDGRLVELGLAVHLDVRLAVVDEHSFCYLPLQGLLEGLKDLHVERLLVTFSLRVKDVQVFGEGIAQVLLLDGLAVSRLCSVKARESTFAVVAGLETHLSTVLAGSLVGAVGPAVATSASLFRQAEYAAWLATWLSSSQVFACQLSLEADPTSFNSFDVQVQPLALLLYHLLQLLSYK